jgi:single-stranded-DNA-specific exonuclease
MNKKWQIYQTDALKVEEISRKYNINKLLATILVNRDIVDEEKINKFLNPKRSDFYAPYLLPDMEIAIQRIIEAIENKERIVIYGDYDVDGITSVTVLKKFLEERGMEVSEYIPNRLEEGYGLNKEAIKEIAGQGKQLMITVDCGISAVEEVEYANELGLETIITDHHEPGNKLPNAIAIIDAKRKDNTYPFRNLAGVGVVFKLIQALGIRLKLEEKEYLKYLDIVCIGTISDIVPLVDENRVIVKLGLKLVEQTRNLGLKAIIESSGYSKVDSSTISFGVAPRINACGRMGHQEEALNLFLAEDIDEVKRLTQRLNDYNKTRQETEKKIYNDAIEEIERNKLYNKNTIVIMQKNWHHGVIGIVSSKITEIYFKPSILLCEEGENGKGSGRSIPGFDLYEALTECKENVDKFGGHSMAIGINIKKDKFEKFKDQLEEIAEKKEIEKIVPILKIDAQIELDDINKEMVESLKELEPFGEENKMPVFVFKNLKIDSIRALSEGKHLKLTLKENKNIVNAIGFNLGELSNEYKIGDKIDVVGSLEINTFNGTNNIQINIKDIMKSVE